MRHFWRLAFIAMLVTAGPARADVLEEIGGRTFVLYDGNVAHTISYEKVGDRTLIHSGNGADGSSTTYFIEANGSVSAPSSALTSRFQFFDRGIVQRGGEVVYIYILTPEGDLRLLGKTGTGYYDQLWVDASKSDARARSLAGRRASGGVGEPGLAAARAEYDAYSADLNRMLGRRMPLQNSTSAASAGVPSHTVSGTKSPLLGARVPVSEPTRQPMATLPTTPNVATFSTLPEIATAASSTDSGRARTGPRHALVVANSRYTPVLGSLPNPVNDGRLVAGALRAAGFQVEVVTDADQRTMKQAIARLGSRLAAAGEGATGLFYYAGHGVQARGVNYLLPVNAEPRTEADVDLDGVAADNVLKQMEDAGAATNIVILDACRDMPLARGSRTASRGLVRMEAPNGSYLAYSTAPGQTATDGGGTNSPFATALAAEIARPNQPIEGVFRNVRRAVSTATGGKQTPWDASSLFDSFVFTAK